MKSIFGGIATGGMATFRKLIHRFMDTRTYHEKHKNDLEKMEIKKATKQDKYQYKLEVLKLKKSK